MLIALCGRTTTGDSFETTTFGAVAEAVSGKVFQDLCKDFFRKYDTTRILIPNRRYQALRKDERRAQAFDRFRKAVKQGFLSRSREGILSPRHFPGVLLAKGFRFRIKRQLWSYSGFGIDTHSSAEHRYVDGQLQRSNKPVALRGLNRNHNHDLKNIFKGAATIAATKSGPFQEFYAALVAKGMRPEMARLTLARKIAVIALIVWKKGVCVDAKHLKPQTA